MLVLISQELSCDSIAINFKYISSPLIPSIHEPICKMTNFSKRKIDDLVLNYFIQEGYQSAAVSFAKDINKNLVYEKTSKDKGKHPLPLELSQITITNDEEFSNAIEGYLKQDISVQQDGSGTNSKLASAYATINQRKEIKLLILKGEITQAIQKLGEYYPSILDSNNLLHFKLLRLNLIEMIREHRLSSIVDTTEVEKRFLDDILTFVRENLISKVTSNMKLLKELEITMSLLCFNFGIAEDSVEHRKDLPDELRSLFDPSLRLQCYRLVNRAILNLSECDIPRFNKDCSQAIPRNFNLVQFDLSTIDKFDNSGIVTKEDEENDNSVYDFDDTLDVSSIEIASALDNNDKYQKLVDESDESDEENYELEEIALESKLEKIVKLWNTTEQRLVDLNISKEKKPLVRENSL